MKQAPSLIGVELGYMEQAVKIAMFAYGDDAWICASLSIHGLISRTH